MKDITTEEAAVNLVKKAQEFYANPPKSWQFWRKKTFEFFCPGHIDNIAPNQQESDAKLIIKACQKLLPNTLNRKWYVRKSTPISVDGVTIMAIGYK